MYSVAAAIWNQIAEKEKLQTAWARKMFKLDQDDLTDALESESDRMEAQGVTSSAVRLAYLTVKPLLLENIAISQFIMDTERIDLRSALPDICTVYEAVTLAAMDHPLTPIQQKVLSGLLQSSTTYYEEGRDTSAEFSYLDKCKKGDKKPKRHSINFERFGRDFFHLYFGDQRDVSVTALSKILGVGGISKWGTTFQAWVGMWGLPYLIKKGRMRVTPELLAVWFEREYNRRQTLTKRLVLSNH